MKIRYLVERYTINGKTGVWSLTSNERLNEYDKRKVLTDAIKHGFKFDRKEDAYILKADGDLFMCDRAIKITKYLI